MDFTVKVEPSSYLRSIRTPFAEPLLRCPSENETSPLRLRAIASNASQSVDFPALFAPTTIVSPLPAMPALGWARVSFPTPLNPRKPSTLMDCTCGVVSASGLMARLCSSRRRRSLTSSQFMCRTRRRMLKTSELICRSNISVNRSTATTSAPSAIRGPQPAINSLELHISRASAVWDSSSASVHDTLSLRTCPLGSG